MSEFRILETDRQFADSPSTGDPACLCSRCGKRIAVDDGPAVRCWDDSGAEWRYHHSCLNIVAPAGAELDRTIYALHGVLKPFNVCPLCFKRDGLFEVSGNPLLVDGWGCHHCEFYRHKGHILPNGGNVASDWPFKRPASVPSAAKGGAENQDKESDNDD